MPRKIRIAAVVVAALVAVVVAGFGGAYYAARQVRPFYAQALKLEPEVLERGGRELESRASALYSDAQQRGEWQALFTAEQINGWLATQLAQHQGGELPPNFRDPRVAIGKDLLTLGFRTQSGGVDTVVSVSASVSLMEEGSVAIRFLSVSAGSLPLPMLPLADQLAAACKELKLPVRWTTQDGKPVAIVEVHSEKSKYEFHIESISLGENELYVAGRTDSATATGDVSGRANNRRAGKKKSFALDDFELRLTPTDEHSALEIARRQSAKQSAEADATGR